MKGKIFLILGVSALSIVSCKKDYTCKCYMKVFYSNKPQVYDKDTVKAMRRKADKHCTSLNLKAKKDGTDSIVCYAYTNNYK